MKHLFPFYINDLKTAFRMAGELGLSQFLRKWFDGQISTEIMKPAHRAAASLLHALIGTSQDTGKSLLTFYITHDWHLFLLKEYYLGLRHEDNGGIEYLEGIILYSGRDGTYLAHHQCASKRLEDIECFPQ